MSWLARFLVLGLLLVQSLPAQASWCTEPGQAVRACLDGGCCQAEQPTAPQPKQDCCESIAVVTAPALTTANGAVELLGVSPAPLIPRLPGVRPYRVQQPPAAAPPAPHPFLSCIRLLI